MGDRRRRRCRRSGVVFFEFAGRRCRGGSRTVVFVRLLLMRVLVCVCGRVCACFVQLLYFRLTAAFGGGGGGCEQC